jgi:hypothetical protein
MMPISRDNGSRITKGLLSSRYVIFIFCHPLTTAKLTHLTYPSSFNGAETQPPAQLRVIRFIRFYLRSRWRSLTANFYEVPFILRNGRMGKKGYNPNPPAPRESLPIINSQSDRPHSRHSPVTVCVNLARRLHHFCTYRMQPTL